MYLCTSWHYILKIFYSHIRNDFGFHSKYFMVMSEMILDSTQNFRVTSEMILDSTQIILWLCQKWFWIPLQIFYGDVRNSDKRPCLIVWHLSLQRVLWKRPHQTCAQGWASIHHISLSWFVFNPNLPLCDLESSSQALLLSLRAICKLLFSI